MILIDRGARRIYTVFDRKNPVSTGRANRIVEQPGVHRCQMRHIAGHGQRENVEKRRGVAIISVVKRVWLPILIVVAAVVGGVAVANLRSFFGSNAILTTPKNTDSAERFNPKVVTYEVFGSGDTAVINYLDLDSKPQRVAEATLPWTLTLRTTAPAATPNIIAQGDGHAISCRITVDDVVKDERTAAGVDAETYCFVKSA